MDEAGEAAVFRGDRDRTRERVYATDFHNGRVAVYDSALATDPAPTARSATRRFRSGTRRFGIQTAGNRVFVSYVWRAPVNGNDAPTGGYVDEFDLKGRLIARVAHRGALDAAVGDDGGTAVVRAVRRCPARRQLR